MPEFKNPYRICQESVNDNQKAILCTTCLSWIQRKCNGTTLKEYNKLEAEDENVPWQCILCDTDDMASKVPFAHLSKMELNDLYGLDIPSQLSYYPLISSNQNLLTYPLLITSILMKIVFRQLIRNIMIYQNFLNFILPYQANIFFISCQYKKFVEKF